MTIQEARSVYKRHNIDKDNITNKDFALERDAARYELFQKLSFQEITDFEYFFYNKPRNASDVVQSIRRHMERTIVGNG